MSGLNFNRKYLIAVFAAGIAALAADGVARAQPSVSGVTNAQAPSIPQSPAPFALQNKRQRMTAKARAEAAASLYKQLAEAPDNASAALIAAALEKFWRLSGSDTADLLLERATLAFQMQDQELATKILSSLTSISPNFAEGWHQLATVHFLRQDYNSAMRELQQVLVLNPKHYKALEGVAIILRETGQNRAALAMIRRVLKIYPRMKSALQAEAELAREVEGQRI
jgi:tetratricopeptide (TPR) repeat protein